MEKNQSVNGFCFATKEDAALAMQEKEKIAYLERHMDYRTPCNVLAIYRKAIESRTFRTPVGLEYLKKLQSYLEKSIVRDDVPDIPIYDNYVLPKETQRMEARRRVRHDPTKEIRKKYKNSLLCNVILVFVVIAMFVITIKGENANILNYKNAVTNEYAAWEQELSERENAVRAKEKELGMNMN